MTLKAVLIAALLAAVPARAAEVTVRTIDEADATRTLVHEIVLEAPAAEVWRAIATAEGWRTWAVPAAWTPPGDPDAIDASYNRAARPGAPDTIQQRIVARIPGRLLAFRTVKVPQGFPHSDSYAKVVSVFELEPVGAAATRVRLTGAGYASDAAGNALIGFFTQGNRVSLEQLRDRFVSGPIDWATRLATPAKAPRQ